MQRAKQTQEGVALVVGLAGIAISAASAVPVAVAGGLGWIGWSLLGLGTGTLVAAGSIRVSDRLFRAARTLLGSDVVAVQTCPDHKIDDVYAFAREFFGDEVSTPAKIREICRKYRDGLQIAIARDSAGNSVVRGYFFVFPINKRCVDKIYRFKFEIAGLEPEDIATQPSYGDSIYIGGIAARGFARGELLGALKAKVNMVQRTRTKRAFARAATDRGKQLLIDHGFEPVHPLANDLGSFFVKKFE